MSKLFSRIFVVLFAVVTVGGFVMAPTALAVTPTNVALLTQCYKDKPILRPRSNNRHVCVKEVQKLLKTPHTDDLSGKGYDPGRIDGVYGPRTKAAMKRFQQDFNTNPNYDFCQQPQLLVDGIVGKYTWRALKCAYGTND